MLGPFQQSQLRIEIDATTPQLTKVLLSTSHLRYWLFPQRLPDNLPLELHSGLVFTAWIGPVFVEHKVDELGPDYLRLTLSGAVDGVHEWRWGEGWVQSCLEGISLVPLHLSNTATLLRLKTYLALEQKLHGKGISATD